MNTTQKKDRLAQLAGTTRRSEDTNSGENMSTPTVTPASAEPAEQRATAYRRAEALGAALRAMRAAPEAVYIGPGDLAALEEEYRVACDAADALFVHASWCDRPDMTSHSCIAHSQYVEGVPRMSGEEPSSASATAWSNEEDAAQTVCLSVQDAEGDSPCWLDAAAARAVAAQLTAAADLIDGEFSL